MVLKRGGVGVGVEVGVEGGAGDEPVEDAGIGDDERSGSDMVMTAAEHKVQSPLMS